MDGIEPFGYADEWAHIQQQQAGASGFHSCYVGHVQSYDPILHRVTVLSSGNGSMPTAAQNVNAAGNNTGTPITSGPIPLATSFAGIANGINPVNPLIRSGICIAPFGGASPVSPGLILGEQVLVVNLNPEFGESACAFMLFNSLALPPSGNIFLTSAPLQPGEWLGVHPSGSQVYWQLNGDFTIYSMQPVSSVGGNITAFSNGGLLLETANPALRAPQLPTALLNPNDVQITSGNNFEVKAVQNVGIGTLVGSANFFGQDIATLSSGSTVEIQSGVGTGTGDIDLLGATNITVNANNFINIVSVNLGSNINVATDLTLSGNGNVVINGQGVGGAGNVSIDAVGDFDALGQGNVQITAGAGFMNLLSALDVTIESFDTQVVINANTNIALNAVADLTGLASAIGLQTTVGDIDLNSFNNISLVAREAAVMTAGIGNVTIGATTGSINITANNDLNLVGVNSFACGSTGGTAEMASAAGFDLTLTSGHNLDLDGDVNVNITSQASMVLTCASAVGNMTMQTDKSAHWVVDTGTVTITAATGIVVVSATTISMDVGTNFVFQDTTGNNVLQLLTTAFLTAFNTHTHPTPSGDSGPPDQAPIPPGYPITTNAFTAN